MTRVIIYTIFSTLALGACGGSEDKDTATCDNQRLDPGETEVDCGGPCDPCVVPPDSCSNQTRDGDETGVDCGGSCVACETIADTCDNNVRDGDETGVDCGGSCVACEIIADTCDNNVRDGDETGVDCGGSCAPCVPVGDTCTNNVMDGTETGIDCGGSCPACVATPTCSDARRNQGESDVDCGGPCGPCAVGETCTEAADCATARCLAEVCAEAAASCTDGVKSGDETDVDCGGGCPGCDFGESCGAGGDCGSGVCNARKCADPTCTDGVRNGFETDVDCGPGCSECDVGERCGFGPDCVSGACHDGRCVTCSDGVKNARETDVDCGGDVCGPCDQGEQCVAGSDCAGGACETGICVGCSNGRRDGTESDVDCGGTCTGCATAKGCNASADCADGSCVNDRCVAPSCDDGEKNGAETDVDCGGAACGGCGHAARCAIDDDCELRFSCSASPGQIGECQSGNLHIAAGDDFTCVLVVDRDAAYCWGDNSRGQLGQGDTMPRATPVKVQNLPGAFSDLTAGAQHVCVDAGRDIYYCWGDDTYGQSGDGTAGGYNAFPVRVLGIGVGVQTFVAGAWHTCALLADSSVRCWGNNSRGQLGTGNTTSSATPVVPKGWSAVQVARLRAGGDVTCAQLDWNRGSESYRPFCWGDNSFDQLGDVADPGRELEPIRVANTQDYYYQPGGQHNCRVGIYGGIACLGWGSWTLWGVLSTAAGSVGKHSCSTTGPRCCAVTSSRGVHCWGARDNEANVAIPDMNQPGGVAVGNNHECVQDSTPSTEFEWGYKRVRCRGNNDKGQLGRGTTGPATTEFGPVLGFSD